MRKKGNVNPFIKICGITNIADALKCVELGVHFIGFIFADSPRRIGIEGTTEIINKIPKKVKTVAVFRNNPIDYVLAIIKKIDIDLVQLHGNEGMGYINLINKPVIKSFDMTEELVSERVRKYKGCVPLLDLPKGTEEEFRIEVAASISDRQPVMVAGKITVENVKRIVSEVKPMAIDICSSIEKEKGIKDHVLLEQLIKEVRN